MSRPRIKSRVRYGWQRALLFFPIFLLVKKGMESLGYWTIAQNFYWNALGWLLRILHSVPLNDEYIRSWGSYAISPLLRRLILFGGSFLLVYIFVRHIDRRNIKVLGFYRRGRIQDILMGISLATISVSFGVIFLIATGNLEPVKVQFYPVLMLFDFLLFFVNSLFEDTIFEGYILRNLAMSINKYVAVAVMATVFGLFHINNPNMNFIGIFNIMLLFAFTGTYYIHTRNLFFPIFFHTFWNFIQGSVYGLRVSGIYTEGILKTKISGHHLISGGNVGFEGSLVVTFILIFGIVLLNFLYKTKLIRQDRFPE